MQDVREPTANTTRVEYDPFGCQFIIHPDQPKTA